MRLYQGCEHQPGFKSAEGAFTVELFNRNENTESEANSVTDTVNSQSEPMQEAEEIRASVYRMAKEQGTVTRKEVEQEFGFGSTKAYKVLKGLCERGQLMQKMQELKGRRQHIDNLIMQLGELLKSEC